jgi:hypothetical protein
MIETLKKAILDCRNPIITTHKGPDGDAIGSSVAWYYFLRKLDKKPIIFLPDAPSASLIPFLNDVEFYVTSINGATPPAYQQGWKDVIFVPARTTIKFIAKFSDYADSLHPYMFHCHIALHEDEGMMCQFVVGNPPAGILDISENSHLKLYPNPTKGKLNFILDNGTQIKHVEIFNTSGQLVKQMPIITSVNEIDVTDLPYGHYFLKATGQNSKSYIKSYIKE